MKRALLVIASSILSCAVILLTSCQPPDKELVVYTYDSFVGEYGAGPGLARLFHEATGATVTWRSKGDGGQLLADLLLEADKPGADVVVGLDELLMPRALASDLFSPYRPKEIEKVPAWTRVDSSDRLQPFDYGWFAIIYDSSKVTTLPTSLEELATPAYAKRLILMDPRTSTPGLGFLAWTRAAYGDSWKDYWRRLAPSILAMPPGWDAGYGLFLAGEAPFVLSYSTSPAYHRQAEGGDRYRVLPLADGSMREIELAGIVKGTRHRKNAERFMDFLLSKAAQETLPLTQWMYPARSGIELPASYAAATLPTRSLTPETEGLLDAAAAVPDAMAPR